MAGEGSFVATRPSPPVYADGTPRKRFVLQVIVAQRDRAVLEALHRALGRGSITDSGPRHDHWQPTSAFMIASLTAHLAATIPFAERYLLPSAKRSQYLAWRDELLAYVELSRRRRSRGRSICSEDGCEDPVRGRGLCRRHYYRATGY